MRVPKTLNLMELQRAFEDIHSVIRDFQAVNPHLRGRRFLGAGTSVDGFDFVTKAELDTALAEIESASGGTTVVNQTVLEGPLTAPLDDHAPQHRRTGLDPLIVAGKTAILTGAVAGSFTVTGITTPDVLVSVLRLHRPWQRLYSGNGDVNFGEFAADQSGITDISVLTSEFTISAADTIDNTGGTDTTLDTLIVTWLDLTP